MTEKMKTFVQLTHIQQCILKWINILVVTHEFVFTLSMKIDQSYIYIYIYIYTSWETKRRIDYIIIPQKI